MCPPGACPDRDGATPRDMVVDWQYDDPELGVKIQPTISTALPPMEWTLPRRALVYSQHARRFGTALIKAADALEAAAAAKIPEPAAGAERGPQAKRPKPRRADPMRCGCGQKIIAGVGQCEQCQVRSGAALSQASDAAAR